MAFHIAISFILAALGAWLRLHRGPKVIDPSDDPFVVVALREVAQRSVELAEGPELVVEREGGELAAVVMQQRHARGDRDLEVVLGGLECLTYALDGLKGRAARRCTHAQAFASEVVDGADDGGSPSSVTHSVASMAHIWP